MSYAETLLPEFDHEMATTRKVIACIPQGSWGFRADPSFQTVGWNANHLAEIVSWTAGVYFSDSFDIAPPGGPRYETPRLATPAEVLELFDQNVAAGRQAIEAVREEKLGEPWSLLEAGKPLFTLPRAAVVRMFVMNHMIHHRAFLCAQLRLNQVATPSVYGV
jgi:hypothetical protein